MKKKKNLCNVIKDEKITKKKMNIYKEQEIKTLHTKFEIIKNMHTTS